MRMETYPGMITTPDLVFEVKGTERLKPFNTNVDITVVND